MRTGTGSRREYVELGDERRDDTIHIALAGVQALYTIVGVRA